MARFRLTAVVAGYALLAVLVTWPLPRHFTTHLPGDPGGDTGVYVWNAWVFHDAVTRGRWPLATDRVLAFTGGADLSLHNYSIASNLLALPFVDLVGIIGAFNIAFVLSALLTGLATYALARRLGLPGLPAWIAGAAFAASPTLVAKGTAHFSLVHAAPLPLLLYTLINVLDRQRARDAVAMGLVVAWAAYADAYYPVYCVLMGLVLVATRFVVPIWTRRTSIRAQRARWILGTIGALLAVGIGARLVNGPLSFELLGASWRVDSTYTLAMALTLATIGWIASRWRAAFQPAGLPWARPLRLAATAAAVTVAAASPLVSAIFSRWRAGTLEGETVLWRSSPRGVDLAGYLVPNPQHPWFGELTRHWWLPPRPDAYPEYVASFSLVALAAIAIAWRHRALPRAWVAFTACFVCLSLGPFLHVAGLNTTLPGPWALLRYVPVIGEARSPSRLAIVAVLGFALLLGWAIVHARGRRTRWWFAVGLAALALEVLPARGVFPAEATAASLALADRPERQRSVLMLPAGLRDGRSSLGNFSPRAQFQQVFHGRRLVNGYLSRISNMERERASASPLMRAFFDLSETNAISPEVRAAAYGDRDAFVQRGCVGYVAMLRDQTSPALRTFAIDVLGLTLIAADAGSELYDVRDPGCG